MRWLWFVIAWACVALGFIGIFLPVLPTTPFFILAAFLFSKSSPRFHAWLLSLPLAGAGIRDWQERRVIKPRAKILCTSMIMLSLAVIWWKSQIHLGVKIPVSLLMIGINAFVLTRKSA